MRILQLVVGAESLALVILFVSWLQRPDIAPSPGAGGAGEPMPRDATNAASGGLASAAAATEATSRERASAPAGASSPTVVLQGRLLGVEPPPKDDIVQLWCRRDDEYRTAVTRDGVYAVAGLRPGAWQVRCEVHGCVQQEFEHTLTEAPVQRLDITLQPATVLPVFVVTPAGTRLQADLTKLGLWQGMHVIATDSPLPGDLEPTENSSVFDLGLGRHRGSHDLNQRADANGNEGTLELDRPPPVFATLLLRHMVLARQRIEPGQLELRFVVDPADVQARMAKVRLRVVDRTGRPLAKARVEFSSAQGGGSQNVTGDDGVAEIDKVLAGIAHVSIWAKDMEQFHDHVTLAPGASVDLGDVVLSPPRKVLGSVVDADGKACSANIQWTAIELWRAPHPMQDRRSSSADGDGNFELWGCGDRRYVVQASTRDGRVGYVMFDARKATAERFQVVVRPATKVALDVGGDAFAVYVVVIRDARGDLLEAMRIEPRWRQQTLRLPPGEYGVDIHDGSGRLLRKTPLVVGPQPRRLEVP